MLSNTGFDLWADNYDKDVGVSDEESSYPFAGYKNILANIFKTIMAKPHPSVLDIGFGTGTLTTKLYEKGCEIYGQDFSSQMLALASAKMPGAHLYQGDFTKGLVEPLASRRYDFIVSTYALHHLTDPQKCVFLRQLLEHLNDDGQILIGDIAFETREELENFRQTVGDDWDQEEIYFVIDEMKREFPQLKFYRFSCCAGMISIEQENQV